jgi:hypothetical protein
MIQNSCEVPPLSGNDREIQTGRASDSRDTIA